MLSSSSNFIGREQETNKCLGLLDTGRLGSELCLDGDYCLQIDKVSVLANCESFVHSGPTVAGLNKQKPPFCVWSYDYGSDPLKCARGYCLKYEICVSMNNRIETPNITFGNGFKSNNKNSSQIFLENIISVPDPCPCVSHFYEDPDYVCKECHHSCKQCDGPSRYNCTACDETIGNFFLLKEK